VFVNDHEGVPMIQGESQPAASLSVPAAAVPAALTPSVRVCARTVVQPDTGVEDTDSNRLTATFTLAVEQVRVWLRANACRPCRGAAAVTASACAHR
jgi:hypothetical protein